MIHLSNLEPMKKLLSEGARGNSFRYVKLQLYLRDTNIFHSKTRISFKTKQRMRHDPIEKLTIS